MERAAKQDRSKVTIPIVCATRRRQTYCFVDNCRRCAKSIAADEPTNYRLFQGLSTSTFTDWRVFQEGRENNEYATRDCAPPRIIKPLLLSSSPSQSPYLCRLYLGDVNARNVHSFTKKPESEKLDEFVNVIYVLYSQMQYEFIICGNNVLQRVSHLHILLYSVQFLFLIVSNCSVSNVTRNI